jgi:hypothetical protein
MGTVAIGQQKQRLIHRLTMEIMTGTAFATGNILYRTQAALDISF